ncbi:MAG: 3-oxoacyl-[acyl-carrier-protein] reductase [Nanoarchaeota archaeon]
MLDNKIALVTGGSRGIGRAISIELARNGAEVVINYSRDEKWVLEVLDKIKKIGGKGITIKADVSNFNEVADMFETIRKKFGKLDILVNNAGITKDRTLKKMTQEEWDSVIDVNLNSIYNVTKNALPMLQKNSHIINIASMVGIYGNFGQTNYAASKAGIIGFTKSLAKELGKHGITVNAIAPGFIESDMTNKLPFLRKKIIKWMIPLKRTGLPIEVAYVVAFLASDNASYITGEIFNVNGGLAI